MVNLDNYMLLTEEGILDSNSEPYPGVPFKNASVIAGDTLADQIAVIVDRRQVWTLTSGAWRRIVSAEFKLNCIHWTSEGRLLVGTESARLAWVHDGRLDFIDSFDKLPERNLWMTPWGGPPDLRSLAVSKDGTIYADIHVGWIARSTDGGKTWVNLREGLEMDVHQVSVHPDDPAIVFAATADGFYISQDHGDTFSRRNSGMPYLYARACVCFPGKDVYLFSTSRGPHGHCDAQLYRSTDAGQHWDLVKGLPDRIAKNINTFQVGIVGEGKALVVVEDTSLYETRDYGLNWKKLGNGYPTLYDILALPEG